MNVRSLTVSVALCTHNGERFISDQLLSILGQSQPPREIVLSDDASTDGTVARARHVVERFLAEHPAIVLSFRVLENASPLGVTKNFEQAIGSCGSELIALSDQDDLWRQDRLERVCAIFQRRPDLLLLHSDAQLIDEVGAALPNTLLGALEVSARSRVAVHAGLAFDVLMRRNLVTGATTVIRSSLFETAKPFPVAWVHDEWLGIVAAALGQLDLLEDCLVDYRQHGANQIGVKKLSLAGKLRRMLEPGMARNSRLLLRASALVDRFEVMSDVIPRQRVEAARRKQEHERMRSHLSVHRSLRMLPVFRALASGAYSEFGRGSADAVRDLVQSLKSAR